MVVMSFMHVLLGQYKNYVCNMLYTISCYDVCNDKRIKAATSVHNAQTIIVQMNSKSCCIYILYMC